MAELTRTRETFMPRHARAHDRRSGSLMHRYCDQLGNILGRQRAELALKAARVSAELAANAAREAMIEAQTSNRAKSEFLANMSHELRTPLNAIIGFSQVMTAETLGPMGTPRYLEYARDISGSAEHLLGIINDILDLARIEAGKVELNEDTLDATELLTACIRIVKTRSEKAGLTVGIEPSSEPLVLRADERKMKQIIINLLSNAVKFTPPGGKITVAWRLLANERCRLIVTDTGIGIAPADQCRVLEPFAQVDSAFNRRYEGTGLGLPLTRGLAELHGGTLSLESELRRGTRVIVELPAERVVERRRMAPPAAPPTSRFEGLSRHNPSLPPDHGG